MRDDKGFLLLEVMISILVITGGLLFVTRGYSNVTKVLERSIEFFQASLLAEEKLFELEEKLMIEEGEHAGEFLDQKVYSWKMNASLVPAEEPGADSGPDQNASSLNVVQVSVSGKNKSPENAYSVFTYLQKKGSFKS